MESLSYKLKTETSTRYLSSLLQITSVTCATQTESTVTGHSTAPPMFDSIFTIHAFVGSAMFPLVFTLLPKRDKHTYNRLFTLLKEICQRHNQTFSPTSVSLDFECASRSATVEAFQAAELKGCLFHYCKAIWKKTQEFGLQRD